MFEFDLRFNKGLHFIHHKNHAISNRVTSDISRNISIYGLISHYLYVLHFLSLKVLDPTDFHNYEQTSVQ